MNQLEKALEARNTEVRESPADLQWINLPHGGSQAGFYVGRLVDAFNQEGVREKVIGGIHKGLAEVKTHSLDFLLRTRYAKTPDTKQVVAAVIDDLVSTGLFQRSTMSDPETGKAVDSLALT